MLKEEELGVSPNMQDSNIDDEYKCMFKEKKEKEFSFIQKNRVPSPLNNNFMISEYNRHMRVPSEVPQF